MRKKKTALRQVFDFVSGLAEIDKAVLLERIEMLYEEEKMQIVAAWVRGNEEGWEQNTDWPEHGVRYYEGKYHSNEQ